MLEAPLNNEIVIPQEQEFLNETIFHPTSSTMCKHLSTRSWDYENRPASKNIHQVKVVIMQVLKKVRGGDGMEITPFKIKS